MFTQEQIESLVNLLYDLDSNTKIYIGTDSVRFKKKDGWYAKYASVIVVHMNGKNGCKILKSYSTERDYDVKKNRPSMRLMNEVMKTCEVYNQVVPFCDEFDIEIHVDINLDPKHGSNCVAKQAAGYIMGVTGLSEDSIKYKPDSPAASFAGDHYANHSS